jgi:hypothetical protein
VEQVYRLLLLSLSNRRNERDGRGYTVIKKWAGEKQRGLPGWYAGLRRGVRTPCMYISIKEKVITHYFREHLGQPQVHNKAIHCWLVIGCVPACRPIIAGKPFFSHEEISSDPIQA